jgi:16S rRNA (cytosine967-C5)-methyltransferase
MQSQFKLHRPLAVAIVHCLKDILEDQRPVDKVLEKCFKANPKFGKRDRGFIAENVYDITRHYIAIAYSVPLNDEIWSILGAWLLINKYPLPEWKEFKELDPKLIIPAYREGLKTAYIKYSIPVDLDIFGKEQLGDRWYLELEAMHHPAHMILRVNTIKADTPQVIDYLDKILVKYKVLQNKNAIAVDQRINLFSSQIFKDGWVEVQDYASQQVGVFVQAKPGDRIIDACAGGGGKALHLAALMQNKGRIIALDVEANKLENLKKRTRRAGAQIVEARWIENNKVIKRLEGQADKLLLDVPCSGSGVLRRNPDAKYRITPEYVKNLVEVQRDILQNYSRMVKPEGELIYVTCSLFPVENETQIHSFLESNKDFQFVEDQHLWPSEFGFDGFYMARLKRLKTKLQ